jgi:hypothetical protein
MGSTAVHIPQRPRTVQLALDSNPAKAEKVQALITRARRRSPVCDRAVLNPGLPAQIRNIEAIIRDISVRDLKPIK